ncbi:MAG: hypothetical protein ACI4PQ_08015 [Butyricicoccaceae bacterium]
MTKKTTRLIALGILCSMLSTQVFAYKNDGTMTSVSTGEQDNVLNFASIQPLNEQDASVIEIVGTDGEVYRYDVEYTDNSVITTSVDGNQTTKVEVIYETGEMITTAYNGNAIVERTTEINQSVKNANTDNAIMPYNSSFSTTYIDIGSITFNKNSSGAAYKISIQCKEDSESYMQRYDLNGALNKQLQTLISGIIGILNPFSWIASSFKNQVAQNFVQGLINQGLVVVSGKTITKISSSYVTGNVTKYSVKFKNQYGTGYTDTGTVIYCKESGNKYNKAFYDDVYPQFIKKKDKSVAALIYNYYDSYGFPGVATWNATRTVTYATS